MQKQRVTLFVRISETLKNQLEQKAIEENRSLTKQVEVMLSQKIEAEING